jgi:hypothetical protein
MVFIAIQKLWYVIFMAQVGFLGSHNHDQKGWILHAGVGDKFQHLNQ